MPRPIGAAVVAFIALTSVSSWLMCQKYEVHLPHESAVIITGASTGIGKSASLHLHKAGYKVYAGVRQVEEIQMLKGLVASRVSQHSGYDPTCLSRVKDCLDRFIPLLLDVTNPEHIDAAVRMASSQESQLAAIVNNAGTSLKV